jgi:hypothetical protein
MRPRSRSGSPSPFIAKPIPQNLSDVVLKGAFVARLEAIDMAYSLEEHLLCKVLCRKQTTRRGRQPAMSPTGNPRQVQLAQPVNSRSIPLLGFQQQLER